MQYLIGDCTFNLQPCIWSSHQKRRFGHLHFWRFVIESQAKHVNQLNVDLVCSNKNFVF